MAINVALADLPMDETTGEMGGGEAQEVSQETGGENLPAETPAEADQPGELSPESTEADLRKELAELREQLAAHSEFDHLIADLSAGVESAASAVLSCESAVEEAKGDLKSAREKYDSRVIELRALVADRDRGQRRLPFEGATGAQASVTEAVIDGNTESKLPAADPHAASAITQLSQKSMLALFGQDAWQDAKDREQPFGMTAKEIETLEQHDIFTIGQLEEKMRADAWWHKNIKGFGETKVGKLLESLRLWRGKFPMPEGAAAQNGNANGADA